MSTLNVQRVKDIFHNLEAGTPQEFFKHVAQDVKWTVTNPNVKSHPLAGLYNSVEDFQQATFKPLGEKLTEPIRLKVIQEPIVSGDTVVVELKAVTAEGSVPQGKNGTHFDNRYCWILKWDGSHFTEVRAYLDSAMVVEVMK